MTVEDLIPAWQAPERCSVPDCRNSPSSGLYLDIRTRECYHFCGVCSFRPGRNDLEQDSQGRWVRRLDYRACYWDGINRVIDAAGVLRLCNSLGRPPANTNGATHE